MNNYPRISMDKKVKDLMDLEKFYRQLEQSKIRSEKLRAGKWPQ